MCIPPLLVAVLFSLAAPVFTQSVRAENPPAKPAAHAFEAEILAYEAADKKAAPAEGGILFTGASGIRLWKTLAGDFPGLPVFNRGFGGSQLSDSIYYADRISLRYKPKTIVIQAGGNDIHGGKTPAQVAADFKTYVEKVRAGLPEAKIIYLGQGPSPARWAEREAQQEANRLVRDYIAAGKNLVFADLWPLLLGADGQPRQELFVEDRLHPTAAGYKLRTELLWPLLAK